MMTLDIGSQGAAHWPRQHYERLFPVLESTSSSERFAWVVENEFGDRLERVPGEKVELLAFLVAHKIDAEWELENIVVTESARRGGIATLLLQELMAQARAQGGSSIFLEVRESNYSARALYKKAGFMETGLRKNYYAVPPEDAIICRLSLY